MAMTDERIRTTMVPKLVQCDRNYTEYDESRERKDASLKDVVAEVIESKAEEGDQERIMAIYRSEGYALSPRLKRIIYLAFRTAGIMKNGNASRGHKRAIRAHLEGLPGFGQKAMDKLSVVQAEISKGRNLTAKHEIRADWLKRHLIPIGTELVTYSSLVTWEDFDETVAAYKETWHAQFDAIVAEDKRIDAEIQKKTAG